MKILLTNFFKQIDSNISVYYDHFYRWLVSNLPKGKTDIKFLIYEQQFRENLECKLINDIFMEPLTDQDIDYIFQDKLTFSEIYEKIHFKEFYQEEKKRLKEIFKNKFGDWSPDIIIIQGFYSTELIWKDIFPNALCLSQENAIFSREPFMRTLCYEPFNTVLNSFLNKYGNDIKNFVITSKENRTVEKFKKSLIKVVDKYSPIKKELKYYRRKFKKIILLPLIWTGSEVIMKEILYKNSLDFIEIILSKLSKKIGLCVTLHPSLSAISKEDIKYLKDTYSNFIYIEKASNIDFCNSLYYFKYVDAILNFPSKTGYMALFWDKPVLSLAKTYNDWFKDGQGIEELKKVLNQPKKNKNNILYWYLTHYILFEKDFYKKDFLYNYLQEKLEKYRKNGITFEFFGKINNIEEISKYTVNFLKQYYDRKNNNKIKDFIIVLVKKFNYFFDRMALYIKIALKIIYIFIRTF